MKSQNDVKTDMALWRYGIISPLLHKDAGDAPSGELLEQASWKQYVRPDGSFISLSAETIRKWLYRYNQCGLPGLEDKERSDKGRFQIPDELTSAMYIMREKHPRLTIAQILRKLAKFGTWNGRKPSRSAIYRFVTAHNLQRDPHLKNDQIYRPFAFDHFGQLWMADFLHGPKLWVGKKKRKTYLHVILDDCSRFIVHGGFYLSETVEPLITDLMGAVRRFGLPQKFYTDNGAAYSSRHLKIICARNGMDLVHTPPYKPQGRGKVERFFRTVRDQFLCDNHFKTLYQINIEFKLWVSRYHKAIHSSLQCSPLQKRMQVRNLCRELPPTADIKSLFRMEKRCRVYSDGTIRFKKTKYEVPDCLPGSRVTIYYMPWDTTYIHFGHDMKIARSLDTSANARRFENPNQ